MATEWRVLQLADSSFPTGGFAHSSGLEASFHAGYVRTPESVDAFARAHLWNVGAASIPFVGAAHGSPSLLWALAFRVDALLLNHVANRASRTQGRAFLATCATVFEGDPLIEALAERARTRDVPAHLAPVFGAATALLGVDAHDAVGLYLLLALRAVASAAVRLGIIGPHAAQRLLARHENTLDAVREAFTRATPDEAASVAPLHDILGATHDRAYARLFQS